MTFKTLKHKELPGVFGRVQDNNPGSPLLHTAIPALLDNNTTMLDIKNNLTFIRLFGNFAELDSDLDSFELVDVEVKVS